MDFPQRRGAEDAGAYWITRLVGFLGIILILNIIIQEVLAMHSPPSLGALVIATAFGHYTMGATSVDLGWYPPNVTAINNLTNVLDATGVYGFIFNNSYPADVPYGTYNWCNMPHVRKEEYEKPSDAYTLKYVELIHRHHKRTVYATNSFPIESYDWNCEDEGLFFYGQPSSGNKSAHTFWHGSMSPTNALKQSGFIGTCQFPQITAGGLDDSWQHGRDLYEVYGDLFGFLPDTMSDAVSFRVTQNIITSQVAGMVLNGMFRNAGNAVLLVQPTGYDSLEPTYPCSTASMIYNTEKDSPGWNAHLTAAAPLYNTLDEISGIAPTDEGFHASFDHYFDRLSATSCHSKPLPCKLVNGVNSTTCVTQPIADKVYRFGNWEYSYIYRDSASSLDAAVGSFGVWVAELAINIRDSISGKSPVIYRHNIAHDGSLSRLLSFLQIDVMVWPGMGSEVVFEVYQKTGSASVTTPLPASYSSSSPSGYYIRVLWGGEVLRSSSPTLGVMDMIPLERVLAYIDGLAGVEASLVRGKCNGSIPY